MTRRNGGCWSAGWLLGLLLAHAAWAQAPEPTQMPDLPDSKFIDMANSFVMLLNHFTPESAPRQFERAIEMTADPLTGKLKREMQKEVLYLESTGRTQKFTIDAGNPSVDRQEDVVEVTLTGQKEKIIVGQSSPPSRARYRLIFAPAMDEGEGAVPFKIVGYDYQILGGSTSLDDLDKEATGAGLSRQERAAGGGRPLADEFGLHQELAGCRAGLAQYELDTAVALRGLLGKVMELERQDQGADTARRAALQKDLAAIERQSAEELQRLSARIEAAGGDLKVEESWRSQERAAALRSVRESGQRTAALIGKVKEKLK
jgi:hypothetical protein